MKQPACAVLMESEPGEVGGAMSLFNDHGWQPSVDLLNVATPMAECAVQAAPAGAFRAFVMKVTDGGANASKLLEDFSSREWLMREQGEGQDDEGQDREEENEGVKIENGRVGTGKEL